MKRGIVFTIHSIAGLVFGLFILIMSLSGAVLVFHEESDRLQYPPDVIRANSGIVPVDSCYNNLKKSFPGAQISSCLITKSNQQSFVFTIYDSSYKNGGEALKVFMHPQNGTIQETKGATRFIASWFGKLHSSFFLGKTGEWLLGFIALVFLISIVTGIIQFRKNVFAVLSFRKRVLHRRNLHQVVGVWALLFNLMIAVTGFWMQRYVFKKDFFKSYNYTPIRNPSPSLFFSLDSSIREIKQTYPEFTAHVIYFAQKRQGKTTVYGSQETNSFIHSKKYADVIYLDSTGRIASTAFVNEIEASSRYDIINAQVHYGQFGGLAVKIVYCMFGLTGGLLGVTGFLLWYRRQTSKKQ